MSECRASSVIIGSWVFVGIAASIGAIVGRDEVGPIALLCQIAFSTGLWARGWIDRSGGSK